MEFEIAPAETETIATGPEVASEPEPEPEMPTEPEPDLEIAAEPEQETTHGPTPEPELPNYVPGQEILSFVTEPPSFSTLPAARNQIRPAYPPGARRRGEEGTVVHEININGQGFVSEIILIQSSGHRELDNAARRALNAARFTPATRDGLPVESRMLLPVKFRLAD